MPHHIIFDCDGTLVDSEPLSMRADVALLARFGITMSEQEAHSRFVGKTFEAMICEMTREYGVVFPAGLNTEKNRMMEEMYQTDLHAVPGLHDTLWQLRENGHTLSVGSNSPRSRVDLALRLTGITSYFDHVATFEDVTEGKPAPDIFLLCATRAGIAPADCLVIEDSTTGIAAAVTAGIPALGFVGTHPHPAEHAKILRAAGATSIISDIKEVLANK